MIIKIENISLSQLFKNKLFLNKKEFKNFIALFIFNNIEDLFESESLLIDKIIDKIYQFEELEIKKIFISTFKNVIKKNKNLNYSNHLNYIYYLVLNQRGRNSLYFNYKTKEEFEKLLNELNNIKYNIMIYNIIIDEDFLMKKNKIKVKKIKI